MFPVYLYKEGMQLPQEGTYYIVAGNGQFLRKDTGIVSALIPVETVSCLDDLPASEFLQCNLPKLPAKLVSQIQLFFHKIWHKFHSEANTILYYNKETQDFKVHVPLQSVSHGGVRYHKEPSTVLADMVGYLRVGTIHSHADFSAFHSGIDHGDEENFDGLHVTFGNNDLKDEKFSISASVVVKDKRSLVDPTSVLHGIESCGGEQRGGFDHWFKLGVLTLLPEDDFNEEVDRWVAQVNRYDFHRSSDPDIKKGDWVDWVGDLKTVSFKEHCGEGPFQVEAVNGDRIAIKTKVGSAEFRRELFEVVEK